MCANEDCDNDKIFARGLCSGCYTRLRRNGSLERRNMRNSGVCSEAGCGKPSFAKNFCQMHYDRNRHPLVTPWKLLRHRSPGEFPRTWDSFEAFLADVGERPTSRHQLRRITPDKPYSKDNVQWLEPVTLPDYYTPDQRKAYEREWRFQRKFGITVADYERMLVEQSGLCAICERPSSQVHARSGKLRDLAVDHDHVTGKVRGLLCTDCNTTLGLVQDSSARLRAMADYLECHQSPRVVSGMKCVAVLPTELGAVTGLRIENGAVVASSEAGIDFVIPANKLGPSPDRW